MRKTVAILSVCGLTLSVSYAVLGAQGKASAGVYTAEQATRGEATYKETCAACHGDNLEGSGPMPPLAGADFLMNWQGKSLGDLYEKTQTTMPATAPGTLMPAQVADILAFLLKSSKYPAGSTALEGKVEALLRSRWTLLNRHEVHEEYEGTKVGEVFVSFYFAGHDSGKRSQASTSRTASVVTPFRLGPPPT